MSTGTKLFPLLIICFTVLELLHPCGDAAVSQHHAITGPMLPASGQCWSVAGAQGHVNRDLSISTINHLFYCYGVITYSAYHLCGANFGIVGHFLYLLMP